jgi:hypothetical protein
MWGWQSFTMLRLLVKFLSISERGAVVERPRYRGVDMAGVNTRLLF